MDLLLEGAEDWRLPAGPHRHQGRGIPLQLWAAIADHTGLRVIATSQSPEALAQGADALAEHGIDDLHIHAAEGREIRGLIEQIRQDWGGVAQADDDGNDLTIDDPAS